MKPKAQVETSSAHLNLISELPITKESTTSRVILNNPLLRIVFFALDEGQLLTEHASTRAVTVQLLTGAMDFTIGGVAHHMLPGDVIYLAPNERHELVATAPSHMSLVLIDTEYQPENSITCGTKD